MTDESLRDRLSNAVSQALRPRADVLAGWEAGSAAFGASDAYSDLDLNFLITDEASVADLYGAVEGALQTVAPVSATHVAPPGRYFKLATGSEFLLVDVCLIRVSADDHMLDVERHGRAVPLFDKSDWLRPRPFDEPAVAAKRTQRLGELRSWFGVSQSFVRKAILRGEEAEAMASFWGYTLKPLMELVRMRHCPTRWDFGVRYLDRNLPLSAAERFRELVCPRDVQDLAIKLSKAEAWSVELLRELD